MRTAELPASKMTDAFINLGTKMKALADAAVAWWEDHDRQDCHFCKPQVPLGSYTGLPTHDMGCPVGDYIEALREASL